MEKLLSTTRQLGNSKPDTTIPTPYTSLPSASRQERAIWTTSTVQNRTQLLRGILPKICPFSRPSLPMRRTYTDTRTCYPIMPYLWKTPHCPTQSVTNAVPPWPPWHQGRYRSYDILPRKLWGLHKERPVPSITIYTPHDRQASRRLHRDWAPNSNPKNYFILLINTLEALNLMY